MFPLSVGPNSKQLISHHVATIGVRFRYVCIIHIVFIATDLRTYMNIVMYVHSKASVITVKENICSFMYICKQLRSAYVRVYIHTVYVRMYCMYVYVSVYVSVYAFFRLLRLAVRLLQSNVLSDEEERGLMRKREA